jgi:hypothetical protein
MIRDLDILHLFSQQYFWFVATKANAAKKGPAAIES